MLKSIALGGLLSVASITNVSAACGIPFVRLDKHATGQMIVSSGTKCPMYLRTSTMIVQQVRVVRRPQHGVLVVSDGQTITYQSRKGYVGSDRFEFVATGRDQSNQPARWTLEINVKVTP